MSTANKLTYLNVTKQKLKQAINNIGGEVTDETTFRNYVAELENVYDRLPKTEFEEGESVTLENTLKGKLDYENGVVGIGQTEQDGTPTPSTPIDIQCVTGNIEEVVSGKNLFNPDITGLFKLGCDVTESGGEITITATQNGDIYVGNVVGVGNTYTAEKGKKIYVKPNTRYTIVSTNNNVNKILFTEFDSNNISLGYAQSNTLTTKANTSYITIRYGLENAVSGTSYNTKIMVAEGTDTTYEPYITPTTYQLSLGDRKIFEGDYLWIDRTTGKKYHHHSKTEYAFTGQEGFTKSQSYPGGYYRGWDLMNGKNNAPYLCTHAKYVSSLSDYVVGTCYSDSSCALRLGDGEELPTTDSFKTLLAQLYANGTPVTIVYQLDTETDEEITGTLAEQLEAWYNAHSNTGTTIITSNGNLPTIIKVRGLKGES